jgi:membrane protease YdiL (CAAX protease family)
MVVTIFELCIFVVSIFFWKYSRLPLLPPPQNIFSSLIIGFFVGIIISELSFFIFKHSKNRALKRYVYEFHCEYLKNNWLEKYLFSPLLISVPEELFFRGLLLPNFGFLISNLLFSLVHVVRFSDKTITFVSIFIYGSIFSLTLYLTKSLLAPLIAHYIFTILRIYFFPRYIKNNPKLFSLIST